MTTATSGTIETPVPGPRPYRFDEAERFHGREGDIKKIFDLMLRNKIVLLMGKSGTGKTSLIRAGVTPTLVRARFRRQHEGSDAVPPPPVILLRDWHEQSQAGDIFVETLRRAVGEDAPQGEELGTIKSEDDFIQAMSGVLSDLEPALQGKRAFIIFDQFEELLRVGPSMKRRATETVYQLYENFANIGILISMRSEHYSDLHLLERRVGSLGERTHVLSPLSYDQIALVFEKALQNVTDGWKNDEIETCREQLIAHVREYGEGRDRLSMGNVGYAGSEGEANLLVFQSLAFEYFRWLQQDRAPDSDRTFKDFLSEKKDPTEATGEFVDRTLYRWIDESFPKSAVGEDAVDQVEFCKRLAARIADFLSAGGFKKKRIETDLFWQATRDQLSRIGVRSHDFQIGQGSDKEKSRIQLKQEVRERLSTGALSKNLSGPARDRATSSGNWTHEGVVEELWAAWNQMLAFLANPDRNILRRRTHSEGPSEIELVHDGLGNPFRDWADDFQGTAKYVLSSMTAIRGEELLLDEGLGPETPLPAKQGNTVRSLRWNGGVLGPSETEGAGPKIPISGLAFENCDFKGFLFENCRFHGIEFKDCELNGALFRHCVFDGLELVDTGRGGLSELTIIEGQVEPGGLILRGNRVRQLSIDALELVGDVVFEDCEVIAPYFRGLDPESSGGIRFKGNATLDLKPGEEPSDLKVLPPDALKEARVDVQRS